jgi:hypothetical protein
VHLSDSLSLSLYVSLSVSETEWAVRPWAPEGLQLGDDHSDGVIDADGECRGYRCHLAQVLRQVSVILAERQLVRDLHAVWVPYIAKRHPPARRLCSAGTEACLREVVPFAHTCAVGHAADSPSIPGVGVQSQIHM